MSSSSGTLTETGAGRALVIGPGESFFASLSVAGGESFTGIARIEQSLNGGNTWEPVVLPDGTVLSYDGTETPLTDVILEVIVLLETKQQVLIRAAALDVDVASDALVYDVEDLLGDLLDVILTDTKGRPVLRMRDDGGVQFAGPVGITNLDGGYIEGAAMNPTIALTPTLLTSTESIVSGASAVPASVDFYQTHIVTGGTAGAEDVSVEDGVVVGHRKLVVLDTLTDTGDSINLTGTFADVDAAALATLTIDAAGGFVMMEWNGTAWQVRYLGDATATPA